MKVHLYTILWNEEAMLPFFFRHYDSLVDRYIIYDDGSTDRTLEMLAAHGRVEVRKFVRTDPESFVLSAQSLQNDFWKESRGRADWVLVTSVDEHLYHPAGLGLYLRMMRWRGVTAVPALGHEMVTDAFPSPHAHLAKTYRLGVPSHWMDKLNIFNPDAIRETHYEVGRHRAGPEGDVRYPARDQVLLLHYKFLGFDYLIRRFAMLATGLGAVDRENKFGGQYHLQRPELELRFSKLRAAATGVSCTTAWKLKRDKWWRSASADRS